jgi:hypothetical protein
MLLEEHRVKMSEDRMLGKIFGPMRVQVGRRLEKSV